MKVRTHAHALAYIQKLCTRITQVHIVNGDLAICFDFRMIMNDRTIRSRATDRCEAQSFEFIQFPVWRK